MKLISRSRNGRREHCQPLSPEEVSRMDSIPISKIALESFTLHDHEELLVRPSPIVVFRDGDTYLIGEGRYRFRAWRAIGDEDFILCDVRPGGFIDAIRYASSLRLSQVLADMLKGVLILLGAKKTRAWKAGRMGACLGIKVELMELLLSVTQEIK